MSSNNFIQMLSYHTLYYICSQYPDVAVDVTQDGNFIINDKIFKNTDIYGITSYLSGIRQINIQKSEIGSEHTN